MYVYILGCFYILNKMYFKYSVYIDPKDRDILSAAQKLYQTDCIYHTNNLLKLVKKYKHYIYFDEFYILLYYSLHICYNFMSSETPFKDKLEDIFNKRKYIRSPELLMYVYNTFCSYKLDNREYFGILEPSRFFQKVSGPFNINPLTISYLKPNDKNKTAIIYSAGGIGDIIMLSRFIPEYCEKFKENNIQYLLDTNLVWLFKNIFGHIENLTIKDRHKLTNNFDCHFNLFQIFGLLKKEYKDIKNNFYLKNVKGSSMNFSKYLNKNKKNVVINWKGNRKNIEEYLRCIQLDSLIDIFSLEGINFINIQTDTTESEQKKLKKHNVIDLSHVIDRNNKTFFDTVTLFKNVDLVISTDTSLVHLAGSMDVPCVCLLNKKGEWRWGDGVTTNWYPSMKLIQQSTQSCWKDVIQELKVYLQKLV